MIDKTGVASDETQATQQQPAKDIAGKVMSDDESAQELRDMGPENVKWLTSGKRKPNTSWKIRYGSDTSKRYSFTMRNYAMIYRGKTFMRFAPFVAKNDKESDSAWAQFTVNDFYGKPTSVWPWDWTTINILWLPLDKSEHFADELGGGGLFIKVDESAKCQVPMWIKLTELERQQMLKNNRMNGQALLLKATLTQYEKPRTNWLFWGIIAMAILGIIALWALWQTGALNGILGSIGNFGKTLSIPGSQVAGGTTVQPTT